MKLINHPTSFSFHEARKFFVGHKWFRNVKNMAEFSHRLKWLKEGCLDYHLSVRYNENFKPDAEEIALFNAFAAHEEKRKGA